MVLSTNAFSAQALDNPERQKITVSVNYVFIEENVQNHMLRYANRNGSPEDP